MTDNGTEKTENRLALLSRLSDIERLQSWLEPLALRHAIPPDVQFAIRLCLEEVVSNIIRHGYGDEGSQPVLVRFIVPRKECVVFVVEDDAPHFNPLDAPELPPLDPHEEIRIGGQGLRLLRRFADTLEYEETPSGNRLRIGFSTIPSSASHPADVDSASHEII
jgi:serine/threonine-protein kinase RsbW